MAGSGDAHLRPPTETLLRAEHLVVEFPVGRSGAKVHAVSDISLDVRPGETLGLVGESGCGKSTTGKAIMQLPRPTSGAVLFDDEDLTELSGSDLRKVRPDLQMIFQDPISSLNPRRRVGDIVAEPLRIWASEQHPPGPTIGLATRLIHLAALIAFAGAALVVTLWLLGAVLPYLANNESFGLSGAWEAIGPTGGTLMMWGLVAGPLMWGAGNLVRDRVPTARRALIGLAVVQGVLALIGATGLNSEGCWTTEFTETEIKKSIIARAKSRIILADQSKWQAPGTVLFSAWENINDWVVDQLPTDAAQTIPKSARVHHSIR